MISLSKSDGLRGGRYRLRVDECYGEDRAPQGAGIAYLHGSGARGRLIDSGLERRRIYISGGHVVAIYADGGALQEAGSGYCQRGIASNKRAGVNGSNCGSGGFKVHIHRADGIVRGRGLNQNARGGDFGRRGIEAAG